MAAITPRAIIVDGVRLDNYAYGITTRTGWDSTPGLAGENFSIPGRDGEVWRAKDYGTGRLVLELFVAGSDADNAIPAGSTADRTFRNNMDALLGIFGKRSGLITVDKEMEDGSVRRNFAEVGTVITPEYIDGAPLATMTVELVFPDPLWRATTATTVEPAGSATSPRTIALTGLAGITAPITDATLLFVGPATNPRITDATSGNWIQYTGTLGAGSVWRVNCATFTSEVGSALGYTGGSASTVIANTTFNPGPRFLSITPGASLTPSLTISGSGFSSDTTVKVSATRRFLT